MRVMGLDVGDKTIGVAVSDAMGWTAQGVEVIRRKNKLEDLQRLRALVAEYEVGTIVVGLPKNMNGTIGPSGVKCQAFAEWIGKELHLPVKLWDERMTTMAAERALLEADVSRKKRKQVVDKIAASFILQGYMDAQSKR